MNEERMRIKQHSTHYAILGNPKFIGSSHIISSYKRSLNILKILSFLGICSVLYFIYVSTNNIVNKVAVTSSVTDEHKLLSKDDNTEYEVKVSNATFKGVSENLNHYQINTHYATKTLDNGYTLEEINAIYEIKKEQLLMITAKNGIMDGGTQVLKLSNDIVLTMGDAKLKAKEVEFNLLNKETFSDTGVILNYKNSKISSTNFSATNDNNILNFTNKVSTVIDVSDF